MPLKYPLLSNSISVDVQKLNEFLEDLTKLNPTEVDGISAGAKRLFEVSSGKWQWQEYNGSSWAAVPFLQHNVDQLDGYHAAITPAANTVAVRNASGLLEDSIAGNAATASSAATLSQTLPVNKGGTGATTSEAARSNLGVPPTSHASTNTTHGVGNVTQYGHLKLSDATSSSSGVSGGVAATPAAVKVAKDAADAAQSSADAAMTKASTLATASSPGIVKPGTGMTVDAAGALNASLNNTVTSTSTTQAATANAVKTAYDKAVEANAAAGITKLFNSRIVITSSNAAWTSPVAGWARVTVIGGGGAGGDGGIGGGEISPTFGGGQGGTSSFKSISAIGGSGGGSGGLRGGSSGCGGGGGGEAGHVVSGYVYLDVSSSVKIVIGAGGQPSQGKVPESDADVEAGCAGVGPNSGRGGQIRSPGGGAAGAGNGSSGSIDNGKTGGNGGSGGSNGTGYGGGGGGGAGGSENKSTGYNGFGGRGADNGVDGQRGNRGFYGQGGAGGSGAVIIEYYDPAKEVA